MVLSQDQKKAQELFTLMLHLFGTTCRCLSFQPFQLLPSRNISRQVSLTRPLPHRHWHTRWHVDIMELFHWFCFWTPFWLSCYRNFDWLIDWSIKYDLDFFNFVVGRYIFDPDHGNDGYVHCHLCRGAQPAPSRPQYSRTFLVAASGLQFHVTHSMHGSTSQSSGPQWRHHCIPSLWTKPWNTHREPPPPPRWWWRHWP